MRIKRVLPLILILVLVSSVYAVQSTSSINFLTEGRGNTLYCRLFGTCTISNLIVTGNLTVDGDIVNVSNMLMWFNNSAGVTESKNDNVTINGFLNVDNGCLGDIGSDFEMSACSNFQSDTNYGIRLSTSGGVSINAPTGEQASIGEGGNFYITINHVSSALNILISRNIVLLDGGLRSNITGGDLLSMQSIVAIASFLSEGNAIMNMNLTVNDTVETFDIIVNNDIIGRYDSFSSGVRGVLISSNLNIGGATSGTGNIGEIAVCNGSLTSFAFGLDVTAIAGSGTATMSLFKNGADFVNLTHFIPGTGGYSNLTTFDRYIHNFTVGDILHHRYTETAGAMTIASSAHTQIQYNC